MGHRCLLYLRLPGHSCDRETLQSDDAVEAVTLRSWDTEGKWEAESGMGPKTLLRTGQAGARSPCGLGLRV